jgi:hypothetical protein
MLQSRLRQQTTTMVGERSQEEAGDGGDGPGWWMIWETGEDAGEKHHVGCQGGGCT